MPIIRFYSWGPAYLQVGAYLTIAKSKLTSVITGVGQGLCIWNCPPGFRDETTEALTEVQSHTVGQWQSLAFLNPSPLQVA